MRDGAECILSAVSKYRAVFYFAGSGLFIAGDTVGASYEVHRQGTRVAIALPSDDELYQGFPPEQRTLRAGRIVAWREDPREIYAVVVERFEVSVDIDADAPASDVIGKAFPLAAEIAEEFLTWVRVGGHEPWLPQEHEGVELAGVTRLLHADTGQEVDPRVAWNPSHVLRAIPSSLAVTVPDLNDFVGAIAGEVRPSTAAKLLSDASAAIYPPPVTSAANSDRADTATAVLLAAIACEVHIKTTIKAKSTAERIPLIDVILDSPRDVSIATGQLTDKPMKAALGHSLREENKALFKDVTEKLFPMRNQVAHYGYKPTLDEAHELLKTANELFLWLNELPAAAGETG